VHRLMSLIRRPALVVSALAIAGLAIAATAPVAAQAQTTAPATNTSYAAAHHVIHLHFHLKTVQYQFSFPANPKPGDHFSFSEHVYTPSGFRIGDDHVSGVILRVTGQRQNFNALVDAHGYFDIYGLGSFFVHTVFWVNQTTVYVTIAGGTGFFWGARGFLIVHSTPTGNTSHLDVYMTLPRCMHVPNSLAA
jgi:hypothetical protein